MRPEPSAVAVFPTRSSRRQERGETVELVARFPTVLGLEVRVVIIERAGDLPALEVQVWRDGAIKARPRFYAGEQLDALDEAVSRARHAAGQRTRAAGAKTRKTG